MRKTLALLAAAARFAQPAPAHRRTGIGHAHFKAAAGGCGIPTIMCGFAITTEIHLARAGPGAKRENPPGPRGGPGASPDRHW